MKLLVAEQETPALRAWLVAAPPDQRLVASMLLHTELHCAAGRHPTAVPQTTVTALLSTVTLVDLTRGDLLTAASLPGRLRSQDGIHLAVALRLGVDEMLTYDTELATAAMAAGITVVSPA